MTYLIFIHFSNIFHRKARFPRQIIQECSEAGIDGFIIVDLPVEESWRVSLAADIDKEKSIDGTIAVNS